MQRTARRHQIAHADDKIFRLRFDGIEKFWQVLGIMLAVRIHRDGVRVAEFDGALKTRAQRRAFADVFRELHQLTARKIRQRQC